MSEKHHLHLDTSDNVLGMVSAEAGGYNSPESRPTTPEAFIAQQDRLHTELQALSDRLDIAITEGDKATIKEVQVQLSHIHELLDRHDEDIDRFETHPSPATAEQIMGNNFHGPEALHRHFGIELTPELLRHYEQIPFSTEVLTECANTHILVACGPLSLLDMHEAHSDMFRQTTSPWFGQDEPFAYQKEPPSWQLVRRDTVPESTNKTWDEQNSLLGEDEQVPSASVLSQAIFIHYLETNTSGNSERLYPVIYVRTSDVGSDGDHVYLGRFDEDGLHVNSYWDDSRNSSLDLSSSRKFS